MVHDAVVVGLGPCGAVATALLGQAEITTVAFDKAYGVYERPRALALDHEILRVFQQIGLMPRIEEWVAPATATEYYGVSGVLIRRMADVDPPYPLGYPPSVVFAQPAVEAALRTRLTELPSVTLCWGEELVSLTQYEDHVSLVLRSEHGSQRELRAQWAIGCDGAASTVRQLLSVDLEDLEFNEPWLVADVLLNEAGLAKAPAASAQYCEPLRPCWYIIGVNGHRRWQFAVTPGRIPRVPIGCGWRLVLSDAAGELGVPDVLAERFAMSRTRIGTDREAIPELEGVLSDWFRRYACSAALVRPDHYVYGVVMSAAGATALFAELEAACRV